MQNRRLFVALAVVAGETRTLTLFAVYCTAAGTAAAGYLAVS